MQEEGGLEGGLTHPVVAQMTRACVRACVIATVRKVWWLMVTVSVFSLARFNGRRCLMF